MQTLDVTLRSTVSIKPLVASDEQVSVIVSVVFVEDRDFLYDVAHVVGGGERPRLPLI